MYAAFTRPFFERLILQYAITLKYSIMDNKLQLHIFISCRFNILSHSLLQSDLWVVFYNSI